ncbi:MAG: hypothetical protein KIS88_02320 [Anaerolineales bacterium]|nr:hypothetical protein [Anaerolineales bacterium]
MSRFRLTRHSLFLVFVAMGVVCGLLIGSLGSALAAGSPAAGGPAAKTPAKGNTLIVVVDQLSASQPRVHAVWVVQHTVTGTLEWVPLYPAPLQSTGYELQLASLARTDLLKLVPVQQTGLEFSGYFVLDQVAVDSLYTITGIVPADLGVLQQGQLIQRACATPWEAAHLETWVALMPAHVQSDQSVFELIAGWDRWAEGGFVLQCNLAWAG